MADIYFEDCVSLTRRFAPAQRFQLIDLYDILAIRTLEAAMGMNVGEMKQRLEHPTNILNVLPYDEFSDAAFSFRPPHHVLEKLWELYKHNNKCPMSERQRFDELPELQNVTYTLEVLPRFQGDIFLKHPVTGKIDVHQYPYGDFPRFRLRTAHPAMVAKHVADYVLKAGGQTFYLDIAYEMQSFCNYAKWPRPTQSASDSSNCSAPPPSPKRKALQDSNHHHPPVKRSRKSATALRRPAPVDCPSLVPIPHTRKRKTSPEADSAIPLPSKRVRRGTRMVGVDARLPSVAEDKEKRVGQPCTWQRPPRAAKTLAVARMARVR